MSDRSALRFGRRHGFMLIGAICAGVSFIAVFNPPAGLTAGALFAWLMITSLVLRSSNSLFMVPYYALGSEMTMGEYERTSVSAFRAGAVLVGMIATTAASFLIYMPSQASGVDAKFLGDTYANLGVALGIVMTATALLATLGTLPIRRRAGEGTSDNRAAEQPAAPFGRAVVSALRLKPFVILLAVSCLSFVAAAMNAALALHYLTYFARVGSGGVTMYLLSMYLGGLAGVFVWTRVSKTIPKHRIYAASMMVTAVIMSAGYWLVGEGRLVGTGAVWTLAIANAVGGLINVASAVIAPALIADICASEQGRSSGHRDGGLFGLYSLGQQLAGGIAVLLAGVLVERFAGLVPAQAIQSHATIERIAVLSNVVPAVILFAAGMLALAYRPVRDSAAIRRR
jgi:Na+/melibiose symporter-like transporter